MSALQDEIKEAIQPLVSQIAALRSEIKTLKNVDNKNLLTIRECSNELGVSQRTVLRRINEGRFEIKTIGGARYVIRASI